MRLSRMTTFLLAGILSGAMVLPLFVRSNASAQVVETEKQSGDKQVDARQEEIRKRFQKFEQSLLVLAQYLQKTDPAKAGLIREALEKSQGERVENRMQSIVQLLKSEEFGNAAEAQKELMATLQGILTVLQREGQLDQVQRDIQFFEALIKEITRLANRERQLRFRVERGDGDPEELARIQAELAAKTKELRDKVDARDAARSGQPGDGKTQPGAGKSKPGDGKGKPGDGKGKPGDGKGKPGDGKGKPGDGKGKPGDGKGKPGDGKGKPGDGKGKPGDGKGKPGDGKGKPGDGKGKPGDGKGKPGDGKGKPGDGGEPGKSPPPGQSDPNQQDQNRTPGRDDLEAARQAMERAIEELKKARRDGASQAQAEAEQRLEDAKAKFEEILKQLREEERELMLRELQARFALMLQWQKEVYAGTRFLDSTPKSAWTAREQETVLGLAKKEGEIGLEAQKALALLKAEGSSIAFPEAVREAHEDMQTVTQWLIKEDVGKETQAVERDIIDALSEMIEALKKELEKMDKKKKDKEGKPKDGKPKDPDLVDKLAELKMLRSLQMRVNRRTRRMGNRITGDQATEEAADVVKQLKALAKRQARIQQAAYDLSTGRNQ